MTPPPPTEGTACLFHEPWWLDAVAPGRWGAVEYRRDGALLGRLPYVERDEGRGMRALVMPPLTSTLGPWIVPCEGGPAARVAREREVVDALIARLPPCDLFDQTFHPGITDWLPFHWQGFSQTTRYTYRLSDLSDADALWGGLTSAARGAVRKARKHLSVRRVETPGPVLDQVERTFARQGLPSPYDRELFSRVDAAAAARDARAAFVAEDEEGRVHAGVYLVLDARAAYYIAGGADPELRSSGAHSLLLWEAITHAAGRSAVFDFEGSMIEPVERFCRSFGAIQTPLLRVSRRSERSRRMQLLGELVATARGLLPRRG